MRFAYVIITRRFIPNTINFNKLQDLKYSIGKAHSCFDMKMYYHEEKSMKSITECPK